MTGQSALHVGTLDRPGHTGERPAMGLSCGAVAVLFCPPDGVAQRLSVVAQQCAATVVVDNSPAEVQRKLQQELQALEGVRVICNATNVGIAAALNQGVQQLARQGCTWALLLDHDSVPAQDMLPKLLAATETRARETGPAIVVPRIVYDLPEIRCRWPVTRPADRLRFRRWFADELAAPAVVDLAISSGMLVNIRLFQLLGGFRDDLFIDLVDTEFCLRVRAAGYCVLAVPEAVLRHSLGRVERRSLLPGLPPVYPTHHAPLRHYYLARNRVLLARRYASRFPSWMLYELASAAKLLAKSLLFEEQRFRKLAATLVGTWDGIRGRSGVALRRY